MSEIEPETNENSESSGNNSNNESSGDNSSGDSSSSDNSGDNNNNSSEDSGSGSTAAESKEEGEVDLSKVVELGDYVEIITDSGDVKGIVYYRDADLIRILPDGLTNELKDFPQVDDDFDPDLGVKDAIIYRKHRYDEFVKQQDFHVDQRVDGIAADGSKRATYVIIGINESEDSMTLREEGGDELPIEFSGVGIPPELPFVILRISGIEEESAGEAPTATATTAALTVGEEGTVQEAVPGAEAGSEEAEAGEEVAEQYEVTFLGYVEVPVHEVLKEIKTSQQIIPDILQKVDAINDFINIYDVALQKDPRILRQNRIRVETLFKMKQDITAFREDGTVKGLKPLSADTLHDLLALAEVPLVRPVLSMRKRIYETKRRQVEPDIPEELYVRYFFEDLEVLNRKTDKDVVKSLYSEQQEEALRERPWTPIPGDPRAFPRRDTTVFRSILPNMETKALEGIGPINEVQPLFYGIERALTTTYRKSDKGASVSKQALIAAEDAPLVAHLLFPQALSDTMGAIRTGSVAVDSGRARQRPPSMDTILRQYAPDSKNLTTASILVLDPQGGQIALSEFLKGIDLPGLGFGDVIHQLADYGLERLEMTPALLRLFQTKILAYQNALKGAINGLRQTEGQAAPPVLDFTPLVDMETLDRRMRSEPFLVKALDEFEATSPSLAASDTARFAYLLRHEGGLFVAVLGQQSLLITKEIYELMRQKHLDTVLAERQLLRQKEERGLPPRPNLCEHVAKLRTIHKIEDERERMTFLLKFIGRYQGDRKGNWIDCRLCTQHLVCMHERLQLQAFLNSKENQTIQKEIVLMFGGGMFHGHYICRNCGQPIQEIAYDTNLQFDKEGLPMSGSAALDQTEAIQAAELDLVLALPLPVLSEEGEKALDKNENIDYYKVVRELSSRVGIALSEKSYKKIISRLHDYIKPFTIDVFNTLEVARKEKADAAGKPFVPKDYARMLGRNTIACAALYLLVDIQTAIPDYKPLSVLPGCENPGFGGYPLVRSSDDGDDVSLQGITYLACAVASINRPEEPWRAAGFQDEPVQKDRIETVQRLIESNLKDILKRSPLIKQEYVSKRRYNATKAKEAAIASNTTPEEAAAKAIAGEVIPVGFLPEIGIPVGIDAALDATVVTNDRLKTRAWIQLANGLAQQSALVTPLTDREVAFSSLPTFPIRFLTPFIRVPSIQVLFQPRTRETLSEAVRDDFMYQLFLKVCYDGPNRGRPHEVSLMHECTLCGFKFPMAPSLMTHDEGKTAAKELDTSPETFQHLLDEVHRINAVEPVPAKQPAAWAETLSELGTLDPPPIPPPQWRDLLETLFIELNRLNPAEAEENRGELARISGPLSEQVRTDKTFVFQKLAKAMDTPVQTQENMALLAGLPWNQFTQVLESHILIPFQKIMTRFDPVDLILNKTFKHKSMKQFASAHIDKLKETIQEENKITKYFNKQFTESNRRYVDIKLRYTIRQLSAVIAFKNRIRARYFIGANLTFQWIQQAILYGIFAEFLNITSLHKKEGEETPAVGAGIEKSLAQLVGVSVNLFKKQQLTYDDEKLRLLIQARNEKEAIAIVKQTKEMNDEERAIDSLNRRLGLGKWSVGGTKVIFQYDADYWMREAAEREAAGIGEEGEGEFRPPLTEEQQDAEEGGYDHGRDADEIDE